MQELSKVTLIAVFVTSLFLGYLLASDFQLPKREVVHVYNCSLDYEMMSNKTVNGYHMGAGNQSLFFVVKTAGRTPEEIARITYHELAHYFVTEQKEHFLREVNQNDR